MANPRDYYDTLGVRRGASANEIGGAFRRMSKAYHPDLNKSPGAAERMREINEAYETLSDPQKRAAYDRRRSLSGRAATDPERRETPNPPRRGPDVSLSASVTAEEALYGTEVDVFANGRWLTVDIPAGTRDGVTMRLAGQGGRGLNGGGPGDALLNIRVKRPAEASYREERGNPQSSPENSGGKRSKGGGCGCGTALAVGFAVVIVLWIASSC